MKHLSSTKPASNMTCLLIAPTAFYSYSEYLKKTLISCGYDVTVSNDEYPNNIVGKIMGKLRIPLLLQITRNEIKKEFLEDKFYDLVIIVKGRGMSISLINDLKKKSKKVVGYTFDSFSYHLAPLKWYNCLDKFYTFDYKDSERYNVPVIELFSSLPQNRQQKKCTYNVSAIVRNHSSRISYIEKVLSVLKTDAVFVYIFEQNVFSFIVNFLKSPLRYWRFRKNIFFKPLSYPEYTRVLQESDFTIDFAHPKQTGITIRSFEALSAQTKIITNNPNCFRYKHFNEDNTIVFDKSIKSEALKTFYKALQKKAFEKHNRTIEDFVKELIA